MSRINNQDKFLTKKAYEVAYAVWRMASSVNSGSFRDKAEDAALIVLGAFSSEDRVAMFSASDNLERLLRFGADVGVFHPANSDKVISELYGLNSAIAEYDNPAKIDEIKLDDIFSGYDKSSITNSTEDNTAKDLTVENTVNRDNSDYGQLDNGSGNYIKSEMRQSAILERIRQNGNCRLKEIQGILPGVSERTLRYDMQNLLSRGLIERAGNGGPSTYYRTISRQQ
ncbi:MAG: DeoR family transcriptional regulator [Patescibacteria group bacterium]|nr:DeoR family transcriptional regulator [Patescibacteria group bacterium]MDE2015075.1 DeoR family transcriptional regulator [Patescibacteria group bacterium]MDE2226503.1 DeoR family transcriptional regulator [Patescibacteria group bacterium]